MSSDDISSLHPQGQELTHFMPLRMKLQYAMGIPQTMKKTMTTMEDFEQQEALFITDPGHHYLCMGLFVSCLACNISFVVSFVCVNICGGGGTK